MPRHVAFLRGINVGGHRVKMARLREIFEEAGCRHVATFIASGNVVFEGGVEDHERLEAALEARLEAALGFEAATFLRPLDRLREITTTELPPASDDDAFNVHVFFLRTESDDDMKRRLKELESPEDVFHAVGREVFWHRRGRMTDSPISTADLTRALGGPDQTSRNMNTLRRMVARFGDE